MRIVGGGPGGADLVLAANLTDNADVLTASTPGGGGSLPAGPHAVQLSFNGEDYTSGPDGTQQVRWVA